MNRQIFKPVSFIFLTLLSFAASGVADQSAVTPVKAVGTVSSAGVETANASSADNASEVQGSRRKAVSSREGLSEETEQAAINFAQQHHPAMASLVKRLRSRDFDAYSKAVRELSADSIRLTRLKARQPQRFETELDLWKVDSEIRLQLARWSVSGSDRIESTLRRLLSKRQGLRRERLALERERLESRIKVIGEQLSLQESQLKDDVEREWTRLTRRLRPMGDKTPGRRKSFKDDSKPTAEKSEPEKKGAAKPQMSEIRSGKSQAAKPEKL